MSYHYTRLGMQQPSDPYGINQCFTQYREEAQEVIDGIRDNIQMVRQIQPPIAAVTDRDLKALLEKYRKANLCPTLTATNEKYKDELQELVDRSKAEVEAAKEVAQQKQAMQQEFKQGETQIMIIGAISFTVVTIAAVVTMYLLFRDKEPEAKPVVEEPADLSDEVEVVYGREV